MAKSLDAEVAAFRGWPLDEGPHPYLWLDALAVKTREEGRILRVAVVLATAVSGDGVREILGLGSFTSEDEVARSVILADLTVRGHMACGSSSVITMKVPRGRSTRS